jgi:hypothetical protein
VSTSRRHGKHSSAPKPGDEAVDYSGELATQVTPDEGAKPTAPGSIEIDYQAAARKPSRPPNYDLQNHYNDHGSSQHRVYKTYNGPNHFAPGPIEQGTRTDTQVTDHDLESLVEINHTPTPVPAGLRRAGQSITTRDEEDITTTQYQGRPVRLPTRLPTRPSAAVQVRQLPAAGQRVSAGLDEDTSADNADDAIISVVGIPSSDEDHEPPTLTPPAPQQLLPRLPPPPPTQPPPPPAQPPPPPARAPAPPQAPLLRVDAAPTPTPVSALRPRRLPDPPPRPRLERSDVFVADEFEHAALQNSPWVILGALGVGLTLLGTITVFFLLLMAGPWRERRDPIDAPAPTPAPVIEPVAPKPGPKPAPESWESDEPYDDQTP